MNKTKLTKVSLMVFILTALFMMTTTVWADTNTVDIREDPCEACGPSTGASICCIHRGKGYRMKVLDFLKGDPLKGTDDCRCVYPTYVWMFRSCQCTMHLQ